MADSTLVPAPSTTPTRTSEASNIVTSVVQSEPQNTKPIPPYPALATSKRKFHQILENLTKPSSSSTKRPHGAFPAFNDSPAKRIRLEARARLEAKNVPTDAHAAHIQSQLLKSRLEAAGAASKTSLKSLTTTDIVEPRQSSTREPNYVPWSQDAFLRRLKTFAVVSLWSSKPDQVNEVAWARRGWVCVGFNTVACKGGCEQRVVVSLRPHQKDDNGNEIANTEDFSEDIDVILVNRVADLIVNGHDESCLWKTGGCRDDIYRLSIVRPSVWQPQLRQRYQSFTSISPHLPPPNNLLHPVDLSSIISLLPSGVLSSDSSADTDSGISSENSHTALTFALFGWSANTDVPGYPLAICSSCFRRVGLWLYKQAETSTKLDLIDSHRDYCPWINAKSQAMPGTMADLPAWQVLEKSIDNDAGFRGISRPSSSSRDTSSSTNEISHNHVSEAPDREASPAPSVKSKAEIESEDKARFAKLRELSKAIGLKRLGLRDKVGRLKATEI